MVFYFTSAGEYYSASGSLLVDYKIMMLFIINFIRLSSLLILNLYCECVSFNREEIGLIVHVLFRSVLYFMVLMIILKVS